MPQVGLLGFVVLPLVVICFRFHDSETESFYWVEIIDNLLDF